MIHASSLVTDDWDAIVARLGGASALEAGARETGAFVRPRKIRTAVDLLRFTLAYCLGEMGLRLTAAWGAALGLASLSNVALLGRLRNMDGWLARLVGEALSAESARGRAWPADPARRRDHSGAGGREGLGTPTAVAAARRLRSPDRTLRLRRADGRPWRRTVRPRAGHRGRDPHWRPDLRPAGPACAGHRRRRGRAGAGGLEQS